MQESDGSPQPPAESPAAEVKGPHAVAALTSVLVLQKLHWGRRKAPPSLGTWVSQMLGQELHAIPTAQEPLKQGRHPSRSSYGWCSRRGSPGSGEDDARNLSASRVGRECSWARGGLQGAPQLQRRGRGCRSRPEPLRGDAGSAPK